jgi:hypothetical protein
VDDPGAITHLVAGGVAGVVSNDPERARRVVDGITRA